MAYAHVNIWRLNDSGTSREDATAREVGDRLRQHPGFRFYALVRTAEHEVVVMTVHAPRPRARAAARVRGAGAP